jgi:hypothetical protein
LGKGPFRHARRLVDFAYLSFQRGPGPADCKVFLITPGRIEEILGLIDAPATPADVLRQAFSLAAERTASFVDETGAERIDVVSQHLFTSRQTHGVFLPLDRIDEKGVQKAYRDLQKQKPQEETENEGVLKELQVM